MKRYNNLWEKVISVENLRLADERARRGKQNTYGVKQHDKTREANIQSLHSALKSKTFKTSTYSVFTIYEPKERLIFRLPYYPDRIVHHAIMNVLEPIWTRTFTHNTYSCIKGRGIEGCARQISKIIRKFGGCQLYCLKIDIRKYYPSINHNVMKRLVRHKIKDADLLWLLDEIIDSAEGLPIGNYLSQYLANLYLCYFMHWTNEQLPTLVQEHLNISYKPTIKATEYADDIVFISDSKAVLHEVLALVREYLGMKLNLSLKSNYQIFPVANNRYDKHGRAVDYVGYKFYHHQKLIRKSIKQNFARAASRLNHRKNVESKQYKQALAPWLGWARHSNSKHLLKTIIKPEYYESIL